MDERKKISNKITLMDIVGMLKPDIDVIKQESEGKTFDKIREKTMAQHCKEQYKSNKYQND